MDAGIFDENALGEFSDGSSAEWGGISAEIDKQLALIQLEATINASDASQFIALETTLKNKIDQLINSQYVDPESGLIAAAQGVR